MPQALPSFEELLASLDLEPKKASTPEEQQASHYARFPSSPSFDKHIRSPSQCSSFSSSSISSSSRLTAPASAALSSTFPSPSIIISQSSPVDITSHHHDSRQKNPRRYSPYASIYARRRSLPGNLTSTELENDVGQNLRFFSPSPPIRRCSAGHFSEAPSPVSSPIGLHIVTSETNQPISTLVRRRLPHRPSQSFDLAHHGRRSTSPPTSSLSPVSIPSLPPLPRIGGELLEQEAGRKRGEGKDDTTLPPLHSLDVGIRWTV